MVVCGVCQCVLLASVNDLGCSCGTANSSSREVSIVIGHKIEEFTKPGTKTDRGEMQQQMEPTQKIQYISKLFLSTAVDVKDELEEVTSKLKY